MRITVRAAGVNPSDWKRRAGLCRAFDAVAFPSGVGVEASGIVDAVGAGVAHVTIGAAVFGMGRNTLAEQAILTHWVRKPDDLSFEVAGGLSVIVETALRSLDDLGVRPGETLLVSGASGGIGSAVVQIARSRGIAVIGTASVHNQAYLRELGAIPTPYGPDLKGRVRVLAAHGVDAALDVAGSGIIPELIDIVGEASRVVSVADFTASRYGARFSAGPPRDPDRVLAEAARLCAEGHFRLRIDRSFRWNAPRRPTRSVPAAMLRASWSSPSPEPRRGDARLGAAFRGPCEKLIRTPFALPYPSRTSFGEGAPPERPIARAGCGGHARGVTHSAHGGPSLAFLAGRSAGHAEKRARATHCKAQDSKAKVPSFGRLPGPQGASHKTPRAGRLVGVSVG